MDEKGEIAARFLAGKPLDGITVIDFHTHIGSSGDHYFVPRSSPSEMVSYLDRFGVDLSRIRFLPPNEANDELFYVEESRVVKNDNTFSLKGIRFEAPRHLPNRKIQVRFDRSHFGRVVVFYKGQRMGEARPVDYTGNDRKPSASARGYGGQEGDR